MKHSADEFEVAFAGGLEADRAFVERAPERCQSVLGEMCRVNGQRGGDLLEHSHRGAVASGDEVGEVTGADPGIGRVAQNFRATLDNQAYVYRMAKIPPKLADRLSNPG
jgi:hypothetical protein